MGPRLFGIVARDAPVAAIIRRGPSGWCRVSRWDLVSGEVEAGAWLHGTIYPQRSDLSPDGRWLCVLILKSGARWLLGDTYVSISRLPSLTSVAAWATNGTWSRGFHFVARAEHAVGPPDAGDLAAIGPRYGLAATRPETFAVERRGGWTESAATPPRERSDIWDERRAEAVEMRRARPGAARTELAVTGRHAAFRTFAPTMGRPTYALIDDGTRAALDGVHWADWDHAGRLLAATDAGRLQVRVAPFDASAVTLEIDLASERPAPTAPAARATGPGGGEPDPAGSVPEAADDGPPGTHDTAGDGDVGEVA